MFTWDYEDRLTNLSGGGVPSTNYGYNGVGSRTSKSNTLGSRTYKRNGVGVTAPVLSDGVSSMVPGISEKSGGGGTNTILTDRLGSMKGLSNAGTVTDTAEFDAFGKVVSRTGTNATQKGFVGGAGYQEDGESGYKLLGHRYYDADTGRFLTRDRTKAGSNWYAYCDNNPIQRVDSDGCDWHNPTQVKVDPNFRGYVDCVGEPPGKVKGKDKDQVLVTLGPGQMTNYRMDVDFIRVVRSDGKVSWYFLAGRKNKLWSNKWDGDIVTIDAFGVPHAPPGFVILGFDELTPGVSSLYLGAFEDAASRITPKDMFPQAMKGGPHRPLSGKEAQKS